MVNLQCLNECLQHHLVRQGESFLGNLKKKVKYINQKSILAFKFLLQITVNTSEMFSFLKVQMIQEHETRKYGSGEGLLQECFLLSGSSSDCPWGLEPVSVLPWRMSSGQGCQGRDPAASAHRPGSGPNRPGLLQLGSTGSPALCWLSSLGHRSPA